MSQRDCVRCSATTKKGDRCKRRTCKYSDMCHDHTRINKQLQVKKSAIEGSGQGLFTTKKIKVGEKIADYGGQLKTKTQYAADNTGNGI